MKRTRARWNLLELPLALALLACAPDQAHAQQALGFDVFASSDADDAEVLKTAIDWDFDHRDADHYRGLRLERARFAPPGIAALAEQRLYWRGAGGDADGWSWSAKAGTDGDAVLGGASLVRAGARRQEYFVERERIETAAGLREGLYYTFAGAAYDLPLDERRLFTVLGGVQDFNGDNRRLHLRGRYIHVVDEAHGLSLQLRVRYARDSVPHEYDYFSPRWYARAVPMLQWRRFHGGWRFQVAAGAGRQGDADGGWRAARLLEASVASPERRDWHFEAGLVHSNEPSATGGGYRYTQGTLSVIRRF